VPAHKLLDSFFAKFAKITCANIQRGFVARIVQMHVLNRLEVVINGKDIGSKLRRSKSVRQEHGGSGPGHQGSAPDLTTPVLNATAQGWSTLCTTFCATGLHERTAKLSHTSCTCPVLNAS
jgi:hypothetical protein